MTGDTRPGGFFLFLSFFTTPPPPRKRAHTYHQRSLVDVYYGEEYGHVMALAVLVTRDDHYVVVVRVRLCCGKIRLILSTKVHKNETAALPVLDNTGIR